MATKVEAWKDSKGNVHASEHAADLADAQAALDEHTGVINDILANFGEDGGYYPHATDSVVAWAEKHGANKMRAFLDAYERYAALLKHATPTTTKKKGR